jgi:hypothetical protein
MKFTTDEIAATARSLGMNLFDEEKLTALVQQFYNAGEHNGVAGDLKERDRYRELLEARVAGLERLLSDVINHIPDIELEPGEDTNPDLVYHVKKAQAYLAGSGGL